MDKNSGFLYLGGKCIDKNSEKRLQSMIEATCLDAPKRTPGDSGLKSDTFYKKLIKKNIFFEATFFYEFGIAYRGVGLEQICR